LKLLEKQLIISLKRCFIIQKHLRLGKKIISTRNIISHEYFRIDETLLYQIATIDMVPLKKDIQSILKDLDQYLK